MAASTRKPALRSPSVKPPHPLKRSIAFGLIAPTSPPHCPNPMRYNGRLQQCYGKSKEDACGHIYIVST